MKRFALPCLHFCWVFANVNSLEFVTKSQLIISSLNSISNSYHSLSQLWSYLSSDSPRKFQWVESLPSKRRILKKKRERSKDWKAKEVKPHLKSSMFQRKKRGWDLQATRSDSIKRKKERRSHFSIVQNPMCGLIHTHTSFAFALPSIPWLFPFLPPFTTPFSINHDYLPHKLFRIFLTFTIFKV
jgi:hypothetical protein